MTTNVYIKSLSVVNHAEATGKQKEVLDLAFKQVGFIPNMYANMANAPAVLSTYLHGYDLFRKESGLKPSEQEIVFLAISQVNGCHYCTAAHSMIADKMSGVPKGVLYAIRNNQTIPDTKLFSLYRAVVEIVTTQGKPRAEIVKDFLDAGYQEKDFLYIILASAVKTLSNFSNHAFGTKVDKQFEAYKIS